MTDAIKALAKAQTEMGKALKNASNPHLKSKYADLGSVMDACFTALHNNGFAVIQPCGQDEFGPYVDTIFAHQSSQTFTSRVHLVMGKADMQGKGSAITYARRYGLLGMAGLAPEDDDGEAQKAPPFNALAAHDRIARKLEGAKTLPDLASAWREEQDAIRAVKDADAKLGASLEATKDARKAELTPKEQAA